MFQSTLSWWWSRLTGFLKSQRLSPQPSQQTSPLRDLNNLHLKLTNHTSTTRHRCLRRARMESWSLRAGACIWCHAGGASLGGSTSRLTHRITSSSTTHTGSMVRVSTQGHSLPSPRRRFWRFLAVIRLLLIRESGLEIRTMMKRSELHTLNSSLQLSTINSHTVTSLSI